MALQRKEITFRHWFNRKFGDISLELNDREKYLLPVNIAEFDKMFKRDFPDYPVSFNSVKKYANGLEAEVRDTGTYELPPMQENIDLNFITVYESSIRPRIEAEVHNEPEPFVYDTFKMDDMEDLPPKLHKTGTIIDLIDSTYEEGGGLYGGTVTIITGESGSGKTTLEIDKLTKYKIANPNCRVLYISTEMTRGDLRFYKMTLPAIGKIETLLLMDYVMKNQTRQVIEHAFGFGYDIIVLDSFQDLVGKLSDNAGMRPSEAQRLVIELMIDSAENKGTAVRAIQHLTKGGTYVGSTLLKHTTTAMLELKIDQAGRRYGYYSKNRRGGNMQYKQIYFNIDKEKQEVVYDEEKFNQVINAERLAKEEEAKKNQSMADFQEIIKKQQEIHDQHDGDESTASELYIDPTIAHPEDEPPLEFGDFDDEMQIAMPTSVGDERIRRALDELADDIEFEDIPD